LSDEPAKKPRRRWPFAVLALAVLFAVIVVARSRSHRTPPRPPPPPVAVAVATVQARDLNVYLTGLGAVTPLATVTVRSRVDGQLVRVAFTEGQVVERGRLLAEIDPRPFEVQLGQAQGQLARDRALLENARLDLQRYTNLIREGAVPRQQLDTQSSLVRQYEGALRTDEAAIASAKLQLTYARITSPISGRAGLRLVDPGNIVHATDTTGLVVLTQLEPIAVVFTVAQDNVPAVMERMGRGPLAVDALDREQRHKLAAGTLLTVDNQVDPMTGTVKLKATFPNADHVLFPNQFVNARVLLDVQRGVPAVPATAIQQSQRGPIVYLVKADHTVTVRAVKVGVTDGDYVAVTGVAVGDEVVVEGADRLHEGSQVTPQPRGGV
jgi:membrane fusion protein, multidrug efflux system